MEQKPEHLLSSSGDAPLYNSTNDEHIKTFEVFTKEYSKIVQGVNVFDALRSWYYGGELYKIICIVDVTYRDEFLFNKEPNVQASVATKAK